MVGRTIYNCIRSVGLRNDLNDALASGWMRGIDYRRVLHLDVDPSRFAMRVRDPGVLHATFAFSPDARSRDVWKD